MTRHTCNYQVPGTGMRHKNACDYADVAMNFIDQAVHNNYQDTQTNPLVPIDWNRFRDGEYISWIGTVNGLA